MHDTEAVADRLAREESAGWTGIDLRDPFWWPDPHPRYHRLRETAPSLYTERFDSILLTRHADCLGVLRDQRFSADPSNLRREAPVEERGLRESAGDIGARVLLFMDPPDHTRLRRLVSQAFTPRRVERLRSHVQDLVDGIIDTAVERGEIDVVADLGYVLPATVICELLGVPVEDQHQFHDWSSDATRFLDGVLDEATVQRAMFAAMQLLNYFNHLFDERRIAPRDDLVSALIAAEEEGDRLSEEELRSTVLLLFLAGHETTMNLIGNGTWALLRHPDQLERLRDDPSLDQTAVEELLRFDGPVHLTGRIALEDLDVAGVHLERGQQATTVLAAANRDPEVFADPDRLDVGRDPNPHITFSSGMHFCLGAALARLEGQVAIPTLIRRCDLELLEAPEHRDHFILRGLRSLRCRVTPR